MRPARRRPIFWCWSYVATHKVNCLITRCSNNYGPYQFPEKLIPLMISNALRGKTAAGVW